MDRDRLIAWVGNSLFPHEGAVRAWLYRVIADRSEVDDIIQEVYCRLWSAENLASITDPRAYFFRTARNIVIDEVRRAKIVRFTALAEVEEGALDTLAFSPERIATARDELRRVVLFIDQLPPRCREIFSLRKIEGLSLQQICVRMGLSRTVVENEVSRGLKRLLKIMENAERPSTPLKRIAGRWRRHGEL
jgi:RNA polymerase sigma-70 factor (ECF subfamily)